MMDAFLDGPEMRRMRDVTIPICVDCVHWDKGTDHCGAFPDGIPDGIYLYGISHREPFAGDSGIRFEVIDGIGQREIEE